MEGEGPCPLTALDRMRLMQMLRHGEVTPVFPFGGLTLGVRTIGPRFLYDVYSTAFPLLDWRQVVIEDVPGANFGRIGRVWFGNRRGLREVDFSALTAREQVSISALTEKIRWHIRLIVRKRKLHAGAASKLEHNQLRRLDGLIDKKTVADKKTLRSVAKIIQRRSPQPGMPAMPITATRRLFSRSKVAATTRKTGSPAAVPSRGGAK
jgi:hypothetical protein